MQTQTCINKAIRVRTACEYTALTYACYRNEQMKERFNAYEKKIKCGIISLDFAQFIQ